MPGSVRAAATEVLANNGRNGKAECNHRQKKRLHHACADSEARLCRWSKASDDRVNDHDVHKEQQKLRAGWHTNPQQSSPNFGLRTKQRKTKTQIMIFPFEINHDQHVGDENGNERGKGCAGHSEFWPRTDSENQQRGEYNVEQHTEHLESYGWFDDARRAQRRAQRYQGKLQQKAWKEPEQIRLCQC